MKNILLYFYFYYHECPKNMVPLYKAMNKQDFKWNTDF